mgnify:CR=1 FL=1
MGISQSRPAAQPEAAVGAGQQPREEFKEEVRKAANDFKNLVQLNKVMIFSATYCSYCTVAKVSKVTIFKRIAQKQALSVLT